nr:MAG TPA: hypothetical protein [Herelleviridae sp.]
MVTDVELIKVVNGYYCLSVRCVPTNDSRRPTSFYLCSEIFFMSMN